MTEDDEGALVVKTVGMTLLELQGRIHALEVAVARLKRRKRSPRIEVRELKGMST